MPKLRSMKDFVISAIRPGDEAESKWPSWSTMDMAMAVGIVGRTENPSSHVFEK